MITGDWRTEDAPLAKSAFRIVVTSVRATTAGFCALFLFVVLLFASYFSLCLSHCRPFRVSMCRLIDFASCFLALQDLKQYLFLKMETHDTAFNKMCWLRLPGSMQAAVVK